MSEAGLRPLGIGEILDSAFSVYRRQFATLVGIAAVFHAPAAALHLFDALAGALVGWIFTIAATAPLIWIVSQALTGAQAGFSDALRTGMRRALPVIVGFVMLMIPVMLGMVLLVVPGVILSIMWFAWAQVIVLEGRQNFYGRSAQLACCGRSATMAATCVPCDRG